MFVTEKKFRVKDGIYELKLEDGEVLWLEMGDAIFNEGDSIPLKTVEFLKEKSSYLKARHIALSSLARSDLFIKELKDKLFRRGFHNDIIERVVNELTEKGYLNEEESAKYLVLQKISKGGIGTNKILSLLISKGFQKERAINLLKEIVPSNFESIELSRFVRNKKEFFLRELNKEYEKTLIKNRKRMEVNSGEKDAFNERLNTLSLSQAKNKLREKIFRKLVKAGFAIEASRLTALKIINNNNGE